MKRIGLYAASFAVALLLGAGLAILSPGAANALWCYEYNAGINFTNIPCVCNGLQGVVVERWQGYNADGSLCGFWTYCSVCPPRGSGKYIPYNPPGDGGE
jgi:hypothetical protein